MMNRQLRQVLTYLKLVALFMLLGALVLYFAGTPLAKWSIAKGNLAISKGAPQYPGDVARSVSKLDLTTNSTQDESDIQVPELETQYGTISCERIELSVPLYYGDSEATLLLGAGQYPGGVMPGYGKPFLISGHDATFFAPLEDIKIGDVIRITTESGTFDYSVASKLIADAKDTTAYDLAKDQEQLILYTCYPFGQLLGDRSKRFFVYCNPVSDLSLD